MTCDKRDKMLLYSLLRYVLHYPSNFIPLLFCSCSVFLLDRVSHELVAKVFDGGVVSDEEVQHLHKDTLTLYFVYVGFFLVAHSVIKSIKYK